MRRTALLALLLVAIGFGSNPATLHAEDTTPSQNAYVARMAALPVPNTTHALSIEAPVYSWEGEEIGTFALKAQPGKAADGSLVWMVSEKTTLSGGPHYWSETATLDRYLRPLSGQAGGSRPKKRPYTVTWTSTKDGYQFERQFVAGDRTITQSHTVPSPRPVTATLAAVCLFCKMTLPEKGTFEVQMLSPDADQAEDVVQGAMWTQGADSKWQGSPSWVVKGKRNDIDLIEAHFHPKTKALLGLRFGRGGQGFQGEVRVPQAKPPIPLAKTAKDAATRGALAFAIGDLELLDRTVHWPTLYALDKAAHEAEGKTEPFPGPEAYRKSALESLGKSLQKRPRAMVEMGLNSVAGQVTTKELEGGVTRFTYPPLFKSMTVDVASIDGAWYVVSWPGTSGG